MSAQQTSFKCTEESVPPVLTSFLLRASESMAEYLGVGECISSKQSSKKCIQIAYFKAEEWKAWRKQQAQSYSDGEWQSWD